MAETYEGSQVDNVPKAWCMAHAADRVYEETAINNRAISLLQEAIKQDMELERFVEIARELADIATLEAAADSGDFSEIDQYMLEEFSYIDSSLESGRRESFDVAVAEAMEKILSRHRSDKAVLAALTPTTAEKRNASMNTEAETIGNHFDSKIAELRREAEYRERSLPGTPIEQVGAKYMLYPKLRPELVAEGDFDPAKW